jgi:hypothetical protein
LPDEGADGDTGGTFVVPNEWPHRTNSREAAHASVARLRDALPAEESRD